jgi:hypothetical protein
MLGVLQFRVWGALRRALSVGRSKTYNPLKRLALGRRGYGGGREEG